MKRPPRVRPIKKTEVLRLADRMPDDLTIGERILLTPFERAQLKASRPVRRYVVWQLLATLIIERRDRVLPGMTRDD
jgi:hypothetical protein